MQALSFAPAHLPNAALVLDQAAGPPAVAVVELSAPHYEPSRHVLTYAARLLAAGEHLQLDQPPLTAQTLPAAFGGASLFIDTVQATSSHGVIYAVNFSGYPRRIGIYKKPP